MLPAAHDREPISKGFDPTPTSATSDSVLHLRLLDQAGTPIAVLSQPYHRFEFANDACRQWLGESTPIGRRVEELFWKEDGRDLAQLIDEAAESGSARVGRSMALATSRAPRLFDVTCVPLVDPDGNTPRRVMMYTVDVTDDSCTMHRRDELTVLSHEMRTPLSAIGGYTRLLLHGVPSVSDEGQVRYLHGIERSYRHLANLIDATLARARMSAGKVDYDIRPTTLGQVLDEVEPLTEPQRRTKQIRYEGAGADRDLVVQCDREKVVQIILNLVSNSVKFTPDGGLITIATDQPTFGVVAIVVADSGVGMTPEQLRTVFEPFTQFDNTESHEGLGLGLGMSISREYARGMRGDITVDSEVGRGSVFKLWLPSHGRTAQ